ncbi:MAG TPA: hypothetical protein VKE49_00285 [Myxococcaceae bacterium]|nr:hypothetical protein [Myxococcaceae bacterium]
MRTINGAFTTVFHPDDGTTSTLSTPPPFRQTVPALLVPDDSPSGYMVFPIELGPDNSFSVEGVPSGSYFLQLDRTYTYYVGVPTTVVGTQLIELTADTPDLSFVSAARADIARVTIGVGVGVQPIFSWSPPNLGTATSYQLNIYSLSPLQEGDTGSLSAIVHSGTTFKVPPGFLKAGNSYLSVITARQAPWDAINHGPFRAGTPLHTTDCVTGIFIP